ncbi:MAG: hypothetical protein HYY40_07805 [Bacteroidetes bacterium]|nr:hypothetical protein [Bacteroidota bacterium]
MNLFHGCKPDKKAAPDQGFGYFPLEVGDWIIYDVDSIVYDFGKTVKISHWELKEFVESEFLDNSDRLTYRIERYIRPDSTGQWTIRDVWYANRNASAAERVEENQRYIKLIFPVKSGDSWNGNAYNSLGEMEYTYAQTDAADMINNIAFDSTVTVIQQDELNLVETKYISEQYAKNAGLIKRSYKNFTKNIDGTVNKGVEYSIVIKSLKTE